MREDIERLAASGTDVESVLREGLDVVTASLPVDGWCGLVFDPATMMMTGSVHDAEVSYEALPRLLELEYRDQDVIPFAALARRPDPVGSLHEATGGRPWASTRYRDILAPAKYEHEVRVVLRDRGQTWGGLVLMRGHDMPAFTKAECARLAGLSAPWALGIRRALLRAEVAAGRLPDQARLIMLDENYAVTMVTPNALLPFGTADPGHIPPPVYSVAAHAQAAGSATVRTRSPRGTWLTLHGWRLDTGQIAITIEPTQPDQVVALVLDAYGLSAREREVTQLVLLGHSTGEIAARLFLSPYTVQDHLKTVFDKIGVRSRRAMVAELFFTRYWPHFGV